MQLSDLVHQTEQLQTALQVWPYGLQHVGDPSRVLQDPSGVNVLLLVQDEDSPGVGCYVGQPDGQAELLEYLLHITTNESKINDESGAIQISIFESLVKCVLSNN